VLDSSLHYKWNTIANDWLEDRRWFYTYDANGNLTEKNRFIWSSGTSVWERQNRIIYTYDAYGNETEWIEYSWGWDSISHNWVPSERSFRTFDDNGNVTEQVLYTWAYQAKKWVGSERTTFAFDTNGNQTEYAHFNWDSEINDWVVDYRRIVVFDVNGNETESSWYQESDNWGISKDRYVYSNDTSGNQTESVYYYWDSETNDWIYFLKEANYWSALITSITENTIDLNHIVYPNPFSDYTTIKLSDAVQTRKIDLIDIHGRIVRTIENVNSNSVRIQRENLPGGIYFIKIHSDNTYVKKVIIR